MLSIEVSLTQAKEMRMRNLLKTLEIASQAPNSRPEIKSGFHCGRSFRMFHKITSIFPPTESTYCDRARFGWVHYPENSLRRSVIELRKPLAHFPEKPSLLDHRHKGGETGREQKKEKEEAASNSGHSLFQESFFFCTIKNVGDLPGAGCIYVEAVVERESGIAFAKVYSAKNAMNAVDILASRVVPFFKRQGIAIKEIRTRTTNEYCGLAPIHPFESFLAASHIQHLPADLSGQPHNHLCEQFYKFLLKEFFLPALRRKFQLSLGELQEALDAFVKDYNSERMKHAGKTEVSLFFAENRNGQT
jgi:hypothetical protein